MADTAIATLDPIDQRDRAMRGVTEALPAGASGARVDRSLAAEEAVADLFRKAAPLPTQVGFEDYTGRVSFNGGTYTAGHLKTETLTWDAKEKGPDGKLIEVKKSYAYTATSAAPGMYQGPDQGLDRANQLGAEIATAFNNQSSLELKSAVDRFSRTTDPTERELIAKKFLEKMHTDLGGDPGPIDTQQLRTDLSARLGREAARGGSYGGIEAEKIREVIDAAGNKSREQIMREILALQNSVLAERTNAIAVDQVANNALRALEGPPKPATAEAAAAALIKALQPVLDRGQYSNYQEYLRNNPELDQKIQQAIAAVGPNAPTVVSDALRFATGLGGSAATVSKVYDFHALLALPGPDNKQLLEFLKETDPVELKRIRHLAEDSRLLGHGQFDKLLEEKLSPVNYRATQELLSPKPTNLWKIADQLIDNPLTQAAVVESLSTDQVRVLRDLYKEGQVSGKVEPTLEALIDIRFTTEISAREHTVELAERESSRLAVALSSIHFGQGTAEEKAKHETEITKQLEAAEQSEALARASLNKLEEQKLRMMTALYRPEVVEIEEILKGSPEFNPDQPFTAEQAADVAAREAKILDLLQRNPGQDEYIDRAFDLHNRLKLQDGTSVGSFEAAVQITLGPPSYIKINLLAVNGLAPEVGQQFVDELGLGPDPEKRNIKAAIQRLLPPRETDLSPRARRGLIDAMEALTESGFDERIRQLQKEKSLSEDEADRLLAAARGLDSQKAADELKTSISQAGREISALEQTIPTVAQSTMALFEQALQAEGGDPYASGRLVSRAFEIAITGQPGNPFEAMALMPAVQQVGLVITETTAQLEASGLDRDRAYSLAVQSLDFAIRQQVEGLFTLKPLPETAQQTTAELIETVTTSASTGIYRDLIKLLPAEAAEMTDEVRAASGNNPEYREFAEAEIVPGVDAHKRLVQRLYRSATGTDLREDVEAMFPEHTTQVTLRTTSSFTSATLNLFEAELLPYNLSPEMRSAGLGESIDLSTQQTLATKLKATLNGATHSERADTLNLFRQVYSAWNLDLEKELAFIFTDPEVLKAVQAELDPAPPVEAPK